MREELIENIVQDLNEPEFFYENYFMYADFIRNKGMTMDVRTINISNYDQHYMGILNIMLDAIETDYMNKYFITVKFDDDLSCELSIADYWNNLIMWYMIVKTGEIIKPKHIFFDPAITKKTIKTYIDKYFVIPYMTDIDIIDLNNIIDDCLHRYNDINNFSMYLANTINLEDFIILMENNKEFYDCIHLAIENNVPLDKVKSIGMQYTKKAIEIIKNSKHGLANFFRAQEGINDKQFREFAINIGTKPDGNGGVFPTVVNSNFLIGGVNDLLSYYVESHSGRVAQIIVDNNVGDSGYFARLLGLNNMDTKIHDDPNYDCGTRNYVPYYVKDAKRLSLINQRYYRLVENGMEYLCTEMDKHLEGKTILLRSPMTCKSHAEGHGICYKCYGKLAYIIKLICAGKISAELMSSVLTQKMLSAKHLLEAAVQKLIWCEEFIDFFTIEFNLLKCKKDVDFSGYKLVINASDIILNSEDDDGEMNEYVDNFTIVNPEGQEIKIYTSEYNRMFLSIDINNMIKDFAVPVGDDKIILDMDKVSKLNRPLFAMEIFNNDLNNTLNKIKATINNKNTTSKFTMGEVLDELLNNLDEGGMNLNAVHAETILSNQIRHDKLILEKPDWSVPHQSYQLLALRTALNNTPCISVAMAYEGIKAMLYNPLTFKKNKASRLDLFFMVKPQEYLAGKDQIKKSKIGDKDEHGKTIIMKRDK